MTDIKNLFHPLILEVLARNLARNVLELLAAHSHVVLGLEPD